MKIVHIVAGMPPESGVAAVVRRLADEQYRLGHHVCVACTGQEKCMSSFVHDYVTEQEVRVVTFGRNRPHFLYFSWEMLLRLGKMVKDADVVHLHSNWTFPVWWGAWLALQHRKVLVMSPHGAFDPMRLQHSAWKKRLVGWMDRWLLRRASVVHATCEAEKGWIQSVLKCEPASLEAAPCRGSSKVLKLRTPKIVVIPNGVEQCAHSHIIHYDSLDQ
jgi:glycosyltransferase involved in cell wall biosynthesis